MFTLGIGKNLRLQLRHGRVLRHWYVFCVLQITLTSCSSPVEIIKPLDVSKKDQRATLELRIRDKGGYRVELYYALRGSEEELRVRDVWGRRHAELGVGIPIQLKVIKDGMNIFDKVVTSVGLEGFQVTRYCGVIKNTGIRLIKHFTFTPGHYRFEINTLVELMEFQSEEVYVGLVSYNRKY